MTKHAVRTTSRAVSVFFLLASFGICSAQSSLSGQGISETNRIDTVRIQNSTHTKAVEKVRVRNSRTDGREDTTDLQNTDVPAREKEQVQNPYFMTQTPLLHSSNERVRSRGKIITGSALFGASYGISLFVALVMFDDSYASSQESAMAGCFCVPVLGPVLAELVNRPSSDIAAPITMLCLGWSAAQGIGLTLLITGLVGTQVRNDISSLPFSIEPLVMKDRAGLTFRMRFKG
jgi:hypothetical protein